METSCILNTYNHYVDGLSLFKGDREIMNGEPGKRISERALSVWRIYGMIGLAVSFIVFAAIIVLIIVFDGPKWIIPMLIFRIIGQGNFQFL